MVRRDQQPATGAVCRDAFALQASRDRNKQKPSPSVRLDESHIRSAEPAVAACKPLALSGEIDVTRKWWESQRKLGKAE